MNLFDHAEAQAQLRRDRGMTLAADAQDDKTPGFSDLAFEHIKALAETNSEIHIDLFLTTFNIKPEHPNAFGAPWQRAIKRGIIRHSGQVRRCAVDPTKNAHLYPVYRSLIFKGAA